jgi:hypothetical protein
MLAVELLERGERARTVHGGRAAVHQEGDADRLRRLRWRGAVQYRGVRVRGDAAVSFLADRDSQGDELLGPHVEDARGQRGIMQLLVVRIDLRDRVPQVAGRGSAPAAPRERPVRSSSLFPPS